MKTRFLVHLITQFIHLLYLVLAVGLLHLYLCSIVVFFLSYFFTAYLIFKELELSFFNTIFTHVS